MRTTTPFLCAFALTAVASFAAPAKQVHQIVPVAATGSVSIETHNGTITVTSWNQPNVDVSARIESAPESRHPEDVDKTKVKITGGAASVSIESDYTAVPTRDWFLGMGSERILPLIHYTIRVPATVRLQIEDHNATTHVTGLRGDVRIRSHNGSNSIRDFDGAADIETHNGGIDVEYARFAKTARFQTHNGDVELAMPASSRFMLRADTHRRDAVSSQIPITGGSGDPELRFSAHNGSMNIRKR